MVALAALFAVGGIALTFYNLYLGGAPVLFSHWDGLALVALGVAAMYRAVTR